jgi:hypothetical protein
MRKVLMRSAGGSGDGQKPPQIQQIPQAQRS